MPHRSKWRGSAWWGHMGRTGDGEPGSEVLWRGLSRLADISLAYTLYS